MSGSSRIDLFKMLLVMPAMLASYHAVAADVSQAEMIRTGDTEAQVIAKLKSQPDRVESYSLLDASYKLLTFSSGAATVKVRFLFGHVVSV